MPRKLSVWSVLFGALFLLTALNGCHKSDASLAEAAAREFMTGDKETSFSLLTKTAQAKMGASFSKDTVTSLPNATYGPTTITDDTAEVGLVAKEKGKEKDVDKRGKVLLRREDGTWRVYGLRAEMAPGVDMTFDFEHPEAMMGEMMKAMSKGMADGLKDVGKNTGEGLRGFGQGFTQGITGAPGKK